MRLLRAILLGVVLWLGIFFEASLLMTILNSNNSQIYYCLHFLFASLFVIVLSLFYFYPRKVGKGFLNGILVGLVFFVISVILDSIVTIPLFLNMDYGFLIRTDILLMELWGIILCGIVGLIKK